MKIEKAKIDELKAQNPTGIFEGEITFNDENDDLHTIEFIYRKPNTADIESHSKQAQKNQIVANLNIIQSLIVYPEASEVIATMREYPVAYGRFVDEAIAPFFGANPTIKKRKL